MAWENGQSSRSKTAPKLERKYIEKNRRNHLKGLYKHLFSLLPTHLSQEGMALHDQVEETVKYIKCFQNQLEKSKQKKDELLKKSNRKRLQSSCCSCKSPYSSCEQSKSPLIQVLDIGPGMDVVLINGLDGIAAFHNIIRILHQQGLEVANATFQLHGNSILQIAHQQGFGGTIVSEKLKQVINGSSCSAVMEPQPLDSWDYDMENDIWGCHILEPLQELQYPPPY